MQCPPSINPASQLDRPIYGVFWGMVPHQTRHLAKHQDHDSHVSACPTWLSHAPVRFRNTPPLFDGASAALLFENEIFWG